MSQRWSKLWFLAVCVALAGCSLTNSGQDPIPGTLNFPIAVELSVEADGSAPRYLYVANSNFDLRANTATLQSFDLVQIHQQIANCQGECVLEDLAPLLVSEVGIGSHSDGLAINADGSRLYLPVRSDRDLTYIDVDPAGGTFSCDAEFRDPSASSAENDVPRCGPAFRAGVEGGVASERMLSVAGDPVAVTSFGLSQVGGNDADGDFVLMSLRAGEMALFLDTGGAPELVHVGAGFPDNLVSLTMQPGTGLGWMTSASTGQLARVGIALDSQNPARSFVYNDGALSLGGLDDGQDVRDIQFHPTRNEAYALSRRPEAVIVLDLDRMGPTPGTAAMSDIYEVGAGPSRLQVHVLDGRTYLLVSCFDARKLFIIDADQGELVSVVGGLSGPFELKVDTARNYLYMTDFSTSVIRFVDLAPLTTGAPVRLSATLGSPITVSTVTGGSR